MASNLKTLFQYTVYPIYILSASFFIIWGIQASYNYYLVTIPVIVVYGAIILLLEKLMPFDKEWLSGDDWNLDFTYYIINYLIKIIAQISLIWLATYLKFFNWFPITIPFAAQVILALFIIDFFLFFVHWLSHQFVWLWKLHAIHHSSERIYFLNGEKRHALHQVIEGLPGILVCMMIGAPQPVIVAALALLAINLLMQHTNLDYKAGFLKQIFCVAELHRWHHRAAYKDAQVNFGAWLTLWDKLFKTNYNTPAIFDRSSIGEIGIKEEPNFPKTYVKQAVYPFSKVLQKVTKGKSLLLLLLFFPTLVFSQFNGSELIGFWKKNNSEFTVEVYKSDFKYNAKIIYCTNKADIGKVIIRDLKFDAKKQEWLDGNVQLPEMTHSASCYITLSDKNSANITGYHGLRLFGSSQKYSRVK